MSKVVEFIVKMGGNAQTQAKKLENGMNDLAKSVDKTQGLFQKLSSVSFGINNIVGAVSSAVSSVSSFTSANQAQQEAETKLAQVMRNTMDATDGQIESIKKLTAAQQKLGIIGDEIQLAGAQELGTYVEKASSLEQLIPVMNDMVAQQYGYNASQESAVNIATMMGKVLDGQVGALSRYGYKFDEAQEKILKYGTEAEKVATLAEVIEASVGGMNEAMAATDEGRTKQMANNLGDLQERIGGVINRVIQALSPAIEKLFSIADEFMSWVESKLSWIESVVGVLYDMRYIILGVGGAIGTVIGIVKVWQAVQTVMNVILSANPIGLIVVAIGALIGVIATVIAKWNEWGAALSLFLGPLGTIIQLIQAFRTHWDSIVEAFQTDGIVGGLKRIGQVLLDAVMMPLQQLLDVMAKIPGVGKWAEAGSKKIQQLRDQWNLTTPEAVATSSVQQQLEKSVAPATGTRRESGAAAATTAATTAAATGGTRNTEIHITIGDMIKTVVFQGGTSENKQEIERNFAECLYRVLGMAQVSVG